jgi:hypothetical protein
VSCERNIEKRLNGIAQRATRWLNKFGVVGEIKLMVGERGERKHFWGRDAWENPDATFVYQGIEAGAFAKKYRAIKVCLGMCPFAEAKLFGRVLYIARYRAILPFSIDLALSFYPFFISFLLNNLVDYNLFHLYYDKTPPLFVVETKVRRFNFFRTEIENADAARLWVNDDVVCVGNVAEVLKSFDRLIALLNL